MRLRKDEVARLRPTHPYAWLWEPMEDDPRFVLSSMFGTKVAYLDERLMLCFAARADPWWGVLVCTGREHHGALTAEFPSLAPHLVLPKWLYLPESSEHFERDSQRLVGLALKRDARMGVAPKPRKRKRV